MKPIKKLSMGVLIAVIAATGINSEPFYSDAQAYKARNADPVQQLLEPGLTDKSKTTENQLSSQAVIDIEASFVSSLPWLTGVNFGGVTFNGSIVVGGFWGTNVVEDDLVPVEIRFSSTESTLCQTFQRDPTPTYSAAGVGVFPGTAWDMSDPMSPRRLNICFVEASTLGTSNQIWDPSSTTYAKREYLYVMNSDYDGTGLTYAGDNIYFGGGSMDVLYGFWPRIETGYTLLMSLPATLNIEIFNIRNFRGLPEPNQITLTWVWDYSDPVSFKIYGGISPAPTTLIHTASGSERSFVNTSLSEGQTYYYRVEAVDGVPMVVGESRELSLKAENVASNMSLVGYWNERATYGDVWGYYDPVTSKEYALICARDEGVSIIDISVDPLVEVGFIASPYPGSDAKDVKIYQNYAIVVNEGAEVQIVDLTDVTSPNQVGSFFPDGGGAHNCLVEGDYLYVIGNHGSGLGGLEIVNLSNPAVPIEVGDFQPFYYHDIDIHNDIVVAAGIYGDGIDLIDVTNKAAPSLIANFNYLGSGAHNVEFSADGNYVFNGDEIGTSGNHTRVWDITNPLSVTLAAEIIVDPSAVVHNCYVVRDTLLVIAHYTEGVRIWNVADPTTPFEVAYYDTYLPSGYGYRGCWSVYPYFNSGKVIASDMQTGLYVFESDMIGPASGCCIADRGNVNNDPEDKANVSDISYLVAWLFGIPSGPEPTCYDEANANGSPIPTPNIADIAYLVAWLFGIPSGPAPPTCP